MLTAGTALEEIYNAMHTTMQANKEEATKETRVAHDKLDGEMKRGRERERKE